MYNLLQREFKLVPIFIAAIITCCIMLCTKILCLLSLPELWDLLSTRVPPDYKNFFFIIIVLRIADTVTAKIAVKHERRKYLFDNPNPDPKECPKWLSHTFTEKLFIKFGMYVGILGMGWMIWKMGISSWGLTFAVIACMYAELTSIYENTIRAQFRWPTFYKTGIETIGKVFNMILKKFHK